jgi:hypothetical protein
MQFPPAYGGQPMMYNAQPGTSPQGYMHPAGPQVRVVSVMKFTMHVQFNILETVF